MLGCVLRYHTYDLGQIDEFKTTETTSQSHFEAEWRHCTHTYSSAKVINVVLEGEDAQFQQS